MAGALVGGAFLSASLAVLFDRIASRPVVDFFKVQNLNARLLQKLDIKMTTIEKVLDDAEDKQHTDPRVKRWLDKLKDAVYEAEDLLDEIASKVQRSKIEAEYQTILEKVKDSASSHEKLEEILEKLEDLVDRKDVLGLIDGTGGKPSYQRTPTTSIPDESVIYGRDANKEAIMKWALSDDLNSSNPDVLAIVGLGGLGKTTLAQHVYCDNRVAGCFDKRAWVCVSEEFNVFKLTKDIFEGFTESSSYANTLDKLQSSLTKVLIEKKFFLVLDDVWSKDYLEWNNFLKPLMSGKEGSKILVTSRNLDVADCIKTSPTHQLQKLSDDDCWLLFEKHAFMGTDVSRAYPAFERIGRQIVEKCDGLPLAAKLLGGALRSERNPEKWIKILETDMLDVHKDSILLILKLSYRFLPSHLKRCFAYCAVFPKDYEFVKKKLIRLWMAEGLLTQPRVTVDIEQVGEDCFDDLVSRSFFQQSTGRKYFLMHDLINDLAKSISGDFCFRYGVDGSCANPERIRHLWLGHDQVHEVDNSIFPIQHLRTILLRDWSEQKDVKNWLPTFTRLRVLSLRCNMLPDSIGNFAHLRYLNLCYSSIQRLPDSVATLCNLETLLLCGCHCLVELPATIFKLIHLSQLDIRGTALGKMPPHMGKLEKLGELAYYIVGKESDCSIKELGPLQRLRGHLRIEKLRNVSHVKESEEANLKCKEKLKRLELTWNEEEGGEDSLHERNVLEQLQPHTNIEQLSLYGYAGTRFPEWVGDSSFSNMVELELVKCKYCSFLPPLGQLGSLKRLSIIGFDGITVVGPEFYGNSKKPPFRCLERLSFEGMPQWEEWVPYSNVDEGDGAAAAFPLLQVLQIKACSSLKSFSLDLDPALKRVEISDCRNLKFLSAAAVAEWENLKTLIIGGCPNLMEVQSTYLSSLTTLQIIACSSLESFPLDLAPAIEDVVIYGCAKLVSLSAASQAQPLQHCKSLKLRGCPNLKRLPECTVASLFPSLTKLDIYNCPESIVVDLLRISPNLSRLNLRSCCEEAESFPPENMLLPSTLISLVIDDFPNLTSFDNKVLQSLTCLETLKITSCPKLQSLPEVWPPSTLTSLSISDCGNLKFLSTAAVTKWEHLKTLRIGGCPNLKEIQSTYLPSLTTLQIIACSSLESFPLDLAPAVEDVVIYGCAKLVSLSAASQAQPLQHCKSLQLQGCPNLKRLPECMVASLFPSLTKLDVYNCPESIVVDLLRISPNLSRLNLRSCCEEAESFPPKNMLLPSTLISLVIDDFPNLTSFDNKVLQSLTCLETLKITRCPKLQSLPEVWLPSTLTTLSISGLENLESLDHWGLHRLTSLTDLYISHCPKLQSISHEGPPPSLQLLRTKNCPSLKLDEDCPWHHFYSLLRQPFNKALLRPFTSVAVIER